MASIRIIDEGTKKQRYQVTYEQKLNDKGCRKRRSKTFPIGTPLKEVKAFQRKVETEYQMSMGVDLAYMDITMNAFVPLFMEHCMAQMSPSTVRTYLQSINSKSIGIVMFFGEQKLRNITTADVQCYIRFLEKQKKKNGEPLSPKTIINQTYVISAMFEYAMRIGYIERKVNPCQYVETPRRIQKEVDVYTAEEANQVLHLLAEGDDIMLYFAVNLALGCGCRRSEISALKIQDFDFKRNLLHISRARVYGKGGDSEKETKTKSGKRVIVLPSGISDVVQKVTKYKLRCQNRSNGTYQNSDYLYVDEEGRLLHVSTITNRWCKWLTKHPEVRKLNFHALRHTYCSLMLSYGIDPRALADLMGHANPIISLNTYAHSYMETKRGYVQTLNKALYASADA